MLSWKREKRLIQGELELIYYMLYIDSEWVATIHKSTTHRYCIETERHKSVLEATNLQDAKKEAILFTKGVFKGRLSVTQERKKEYEIFIQKLNNKKIECENFLGKFETLSWKKEKKTYFKKLFPEVSCGNVNYILYDKTNPIAYITQRDDKGWWQAEVLSVDFSKFYYPFEEYKIKEVKERTEKVLKHSIMKEIEYHKDSIYWNKKNKIEPCNIVVKDCKNKIKKLENIT